MSTRLLSDRYVAFLDVLGFSNRLASTPLDEIHAEYARLIDDARTRAFDAHDLSGNPENNFAWAKFVFDSLVVVSNEVSGEHADRNAFKFISALVLLCELSFSRRMPLRGCIGRGDVLEDPERGVILSPVFPQLLREEKLLEWSGVTVLPEETQRLLRLLHVSTPEEVPQNASSFLVRYPAPRKPGHPSSEVACLNWPHLMSDSELSQGFGFLDSVKGPPTREFVDFVGKLPSQSKPLPDGFRPATHLRVMIASTGMRVKFADDGGNGHDPPAGAGLQIRLMLADPTPGGEAG